MGTYKYWAKDLNGDSYSDVIEAKEVSEIIKNIRKRGIFVYKIRRVINIDSFSRISTNSLMVFCKQLSSMLKTGIPIYECLNIIGQQTNNKKLKNDIEVISSKCQNGLEISNCMRKYCKSFPKFMTDMIQVGEECGMLEKVMEDLYLYYKRNEELKSRLISAVSYPIIVMVLSFCLILFLILNVIPSFVSTLDSTGGNIPPVTRYVLYLSEFIKNNYCTIFIVTGLLILFCTLFFKSEKGKKIKDNLKFNIPLFSKIYKKFVTDKFSRIMAMLLSSGLPIMRSFTIIRNVFTNSVIREMIDDCVQNFEAGGSLHESISSKKIFHPIMLSMISIGEESGTLDEMFGKTAEFLEDDIYCQLNMLVKFIEPALLIFMSFIVGFLILSVVLPVININNSIKI